MSCHISKLNRISLLLLVGVIFEFASFAAFTEAVPLAPAEDLSYNAGYKRAGFVGMRGKKSDNEVDSSWPDMMHKRAGFVGMRGKKDNNELWRYLSLLQQARERPLQYKRAGFVGMRGKKSDIDDDEFDLLKRAAFMGMRGRRAPLDYEQPQEEYWPYFQDLSQPSEKRAGFVGMRG